MIKQKPAGRIDFTDGKSDTIGNAPKRKPYSTDQTSPGPVLDELARLLYVGRRDRRRFFNEPLLGEAAWDMLLLLYWAGARGRGLNAKILTRASGVPGSTGERWLADLERRGLVVRQPVNSGHPSRTVGLSESARASLTNYLANFAGACRLPLKGSRPDHPQFPAEIGTSLR